MVHTRHSYNKDLVDEFPFDSHPESHPERECSDVKRSIIDDDNNDHQNENDDDDDDGEKKSIDIEEKENGHPDERSVESKARKRRRDINLYENIPYYDDGCHRRSLRNIERRRNPYRHPSKSRKIKHVKGLHFGSSIIRRSDRQPKKVFETFNESEIQKTIERKHQEMLELEQASMYDSIKRRRGDTDTQDDSDDDGSEDADDDEEETEEEGEVESCGYSLRKTKPKTNIYQAPPLRSSHQRRREIYTVQSPLHQVKYKRRIPQHGSSHHRHYKRRRRASSTSSSDDEAAFERRKAKSMTQGRLRCLPMNFQPDDITGVLKSRENSGVTFGSSLADVDPMTIDTKITFSEVGGLDHHIRALKEMVVFPLLYPEVFEKFSIAPPRGVLFYGPPGTGKTLVARALANECSSEGKKVAFFMRKGADCLSKWVGESERQLRLLFDQAYSMRPSIIFFDEIDGIAPVRSTRQDQIHSSIVSTLLALMDGLDARGEIVVIGATNRLDAIDPALRRPGRFDREFLFKLPNKTARHKILEINTSAWCPKLSKDFLEEVAEKCVGYCGADIKALCTEASLFALRRRYPQIYDSNKKLVLDMNEIKVAAIDFKEAMNTITPASHRSNMPPSISLKDDLKPLLQIYIDSALKVLHKIFPPAQPNKKEELVKPCDDENLADIYERPKSRQRSHSISQSPTQFLKKYQTLDQCTVHRPRFLIVGGKGNGQTCYVAPALLYSMEHLTTHVLDLPALFGTASRAPEESVAQIFREARRTLPSIIYLPNIDVWWNCVQDTTRATFTTLLEDMPSNMTVLFLATADAVWEELPENLQDLFSPMNNEVFDVKFPTSTDRYTYFKDLFVIYALKEPAVEKRKATSPSFDEVLPEASPPKPRELSREECIKLVEYEESILRELRLHLRQATWKLLADRKFKEFSKPVDLGEVDDYLEVIKEPMDLSTVMTRINAHYYQSCAHYLHDIDLITNNCLEYNPDKDQYDRLLRNRACELRDVAHAFVHNDLDPDFENICLEIHESRKKRGYDEKTNAPSFLKVIPKTVNVENIDSSLTRPLPSIPNPVGTRFSRRVRGLSDPYQFDSTSLDIVERGRRSTKKNERSVSSNQTDTRDGLDDSIANSTSINLDGQNIDKKHLETTECTSNSNLHDDNNMEVCVSLGDVENREADEKAVEQVKRSLDFPDQLIIEASNLVEEAERILSSLVDLTNGLCLQTLERIYTSLCRCIIFHRKEPNRSLVLKELKDIVNKIDCKESCS